MQLARGSLTLQPTEVQKVGKSAQQGRFPLATAEVIRGEKMEELPKSLDAFMLREKES